MEINWLRPWDKVTDIGEVDYQKRIQIQDTHPENIENYPYISQLWKIQECLWVAFSEYASKMKITGNFLLDMKHFKKMLQSNKDINILIGAWNRMKSALIRDNMAIDEQMEKDLLKQWKTKDEVHKILKERYDNFLRLIRENIKYEVQ